MIFYTVNKDEARHDSFKQLIPSQVVSSQFLEHPLNVFPTSRRKNTLLNIKVYSY
jgi:hypothetical protein